MVFVSQFSLYSDRSLPFTIPLVFFMLLMNSYLYTQIKTYNVLFLSNIKNTKDGVKAKNIWIMKGILK